MNTINSDHIDFKQKFDEKVEELKETLIPLGKEVLTHKFLECLKFYESVQRHPKTYLKLLRSS